MEYTVRFRDRTGVDRYAVVDGVELTVPGSIGRVGLSRIMDKLLEGEGAEEPSTAVWDFAVIGDERKERQEEMTGAGDALTVRGTLLRSPLQLFCERRGISAEVVLEVEYFPRIGVQDSVAAKATTDADDWIWNLASGDTLGVGECGMRPMTILSCSMRGQVRAWCVSRDGLEEKVAFALTSCTGYVRSTVCWPTAGSTSLHDASQSGRSNRGPASASPAQMDALFGTSTGQVVAGSIGADECWRPRVFEPPTSLSMSSDSSTAFATTYRGESIEAMAPSAGGNRLLVGDAAGSMSLWQLPPEEDITDNGGDRRPPENITPLKVGVVTEFTGHAPQMPIRSVQWPERDASHCWSASWDGTVRLWDVERGVCVTSLPVTDARPNAMQVRATNEGVGTLLLPLVACTDGSVRVLDARDGSGSGSTAVKVRDAHERAFASDCAWRSSGALTAASTGYDGAVRLWDLRYAGSSSAGIYAGNRVTCMIWEDRRAETARLRCAFCRRGHCLVTGDADGQVRAFFLGAEVMPHASGP
ncbi:hypothetical protein CDCA_CDCA03G1121 [Cyanidium caldarium]|uniref:Ribosome biogenesis protein WDR12 homolog n=1 Tax=Cyanidium caldarium TaxID=2771 RepID=A0AAV9ISN1_CYACA|nr:hypothetical protein CDCA_CDCA03G1121 [Cyanidium caldarium]